MRRHSPQSDDVWVPFGGNTYQELTLRQYNALIGAILCYGFVINALMVKYCAGFFARMNYIGILVIYFVSALIGILLSKHSDNPTISFVGYNLVVLPIGMILSLGLAEVKAVSIMHAIVLTAIVTGIMLVAAIIWPKFFLSLGRTLFFVLLLVLIVEVVSALLGIYMPTLWDVLVALVFCGYIGFDWAAAQAQAKTADNAVDACVSLYLDIINLFLRILSISENSRSRRN